MRVLSDIVAPSLVMEALVSKLLTFPELKPEGVPTGRRQIDRLEAAGKFPRRVQISPGRVGWVADEIRAHVAELIARRPSHRNV